MKKIIGWFKNILMRILEVVNYMIKKDNEIELAKLEIVKNVLSNTKALGCAAVGWGIGSLIFSQNTLSISFSDKNVRFGLGCLGAALSVTLLCTCFYDFNTNQNILEN